MTERGCRLQGIRYLGNTDVFGNQSDGDRCECIPGRHVHSCDRRRKSCPVCPVRKIKNPGVPLSSADTAPAGDYEAVIGYSFNAESVVSRVISRVEIKESFPVS